MASEYKYCECGAGFTTTTGSKICTPCRKGHQADSSLNNRRLRERNAAGTHTEKQWFDRIEFQNSLCFWCFRSMVNGQNNFAGTKDHLIPLSRGGNNYIENIVAACMHCNRDKGIKTATEYQERLATRSREISKVSTLTASSKTTAFFPGMTFATASLEVREGIFAVSHGKAMPIPVFDYTARRELLKQQAKSISRHFAEAAGQMQLPLDMPSSVKKNAGAELIETEAQTLAVRKGMVIA